MGQQDDEREERRERLRAMTPEARMLSILEKLVSWADAHEEESSRRAEEAQRKSDEMQRNMNFIVQQQAQFAADMQQLRETQARSEHKWERTEGGIRSLLAIAEIHQQEFAELQQVQAKAQARTDAKLAETGERVDALVNTVERLISERRNGGRKQPEGEDE
jgi:chromosome segregation ATPase